jgi:hypothetical protein
MNAHVRFNGLCIAWLSATLLGCDSSFEVDLADFEQLPALEGLDYSRVVPSDSLDYWEYRFAFFGSAPPDSVIGSGGWRTKDSLGSGLIASFDSTQAETGFGIQCLPGYCFKYILGVSDNQFLMWATQEELGDFLGTIDSREEAIILVDGFRYHWNTVDKAEGGIRDVEDGFELVVLKTVEFCAPVQTNRYVLHVSTSGVITELQEEVRYKDESACI